MNIDFTLYEKDGEIIFRNKAKLIAELKATGWKEMEGTIRKKKKNRSIYQNRYYWLCLTILSNHTGFTKDELHNILRFKFLKTTLTDTKTGELYEYIKSTTDLTTTEMELYLAEIRQFAAETLDCILAEPNEQLEVFK